MTWMTLNGCGDQSNHGEMEHDYVLAGFDDNSVVDPFTLRPTTGAYTNGQAWTLL